jgi:hypothetical protein
VGSRQASDRARAPQVRVWDVRTFKPRHAYFSHAPVDALDISQRGLLALGHGRSVQARPALEEHRVACSWHISVRRRLAGRRVWAIPSSGWVLACAGTPGAAQSPSMGRQQGRAL